MPLVPLTEFTPAALAELWNAALGDRFPIRSALLERNLFQDLNLLPEASFVALEHDCLAGMVAVKLNREFMGLPLPRTGHINSLIVHPAYRRRGIGTALLQEAAQRLRQHSPVQILLGQDPFHLFPGIPADDPGALAFFARQGATIENESHVDLIGDLTTYDLPPAVVQTLARESVEIRPLQRDETWLMAEFFRLHFPGRWQYEYAKFLYDDGDPADYIGLFVDGSVEGFCHIHTPESRWMGPSIYWADLFPGERFGGAGPLGVSDRVRGRGLGLAIVAIGIQELQRRGITRAAIDWTDHIDFYRRLGFAVWKEYRQAAL